MKQKVLVLLVLAVATASGGAAAATSPAAPIRAEPACASGSVSARIGGRHVCLRAGQRCQKRLARQYAR